MRPLVLALLVVVPLCVLSARRAEAARIPVIYQSGEEIFDSGPLPKEFGDGKSDDGKVLRAGYRCDITGVFWSYFSVKNCELVIYHGDEYQSASELEDKEMLALLAKTYPESSMKRGIWNKFGWMLLGGLIVLGIALVIKDKLTAKPTDAAS